MIVAVIGIWINLLNPAKIKIVNPNRISISTDPFTDNPGTYVLTISLAFTNEGAKIGVINDLVLLFEGNNQKRLFITYLEFPNKTTSLSTKEIGIPESKEFNSFQVKGKESVVKTIAFRQVDVLSPLILSEEINTVSVYMKTRNSSNFKLQTTVRLKLDKSDLSQITQKKIVQQPDGRNLILISERGIPVYENQEMIKNFGNQVGAH